MSKAEPSDRFPVIAIRGGSGVFVSRVGCSCTIFVYDSEAGRLLELVHSLGMRLHRSNSS